MKKNYPNKASNQTYMVCLLSLGTGIPHSTDARDIEKSLRPDFIQLCTWIAIPWEKGKIYVLLETKMILFHTSFNRNEGCTKLGLSVRYSSNDFWYFDKAKK